MCSRVDEIVSAAAPSLKTSELLLNQSDHFTSNSTGTTFSERVRLYLWTAKAATATAITIYDRNNAYVREEYT